MVTQTLLATLGDEMVFQEATQEDNTVYIGGKTTMQYVQAVQTQAFHFETIKIMARGRMISKAVDVAEIVIDRFIKGWEQTEIFIGTHERNHDDEEAERVSFISITLSKVL